MSDYAKRADAMWENLERRSRELDRYIGMYRRLAHATATEMGAASLTRELVVTIVAAYDEEIPTT